MATYVKWADTIVDDSGIVIPSVTVTVKDPDTGDPITIYSDRAGTTKGNPFTTGVDGIAEFYVDVETNPRIKIELSKTDYDFTAANEMLNDVYLASKGETLGSLSDVTISSPVNDEVLAYDSGAGKWINQTPAEAGLAEAGHTHAISDLSDVTVDAPTDNELLTYDSGSGKWINQTPSEAGILAADGSVPLNGDLDANGHSVRGLLRVIHRPADKTRRAYLPLRENIPWTKYSGNPILTPSDSGWDAGMIHRACWVKHGDTYYIFYEATSSATAHDWQIGVATSSNIFGPYTKYAGNPIITYTGVSGDPDEIAVADPVVLFFNGMWHMWFDMEGSGGWRIGKATSTDGFSWTKYQVEGVTQPVLDDPDKGEPGYQSDTQIELHCPEVISIGGELRMFYGTKSLEGETLRKTCLAIADDPDGKHFTFFGKIMNNAVTTQDMIGRMDHPFIHEGVIFAPVETQTGSESKKTYLFTSQDGGITWSEVAPLVITPGDPGEWDEVLRYGPQSFIIENGRLYCIYEGGDESDTARKFGIAYLDL